METSVAPPSDTVKHPIASSLTDSDFGFFTIYIDISGSIVTGVQDATEQSQENQFD